MGRPHWGFFTFRSWNWRFKVCRLGSLSPYCRSCTCAAENCAICGMVEANAELQFSLKTLSVLAELSLRKLNLSAGSTAQIVQTKTRVPHTRMQESFASGAASVHVGLLIPLTTAPMAVLPEQLLVRVTSFAAETDVGGSKGRRRRMQRQRSRSRAVHSSVGIRSLLAQSFPPAPSAAPAYRPGAGPVCLSLQGRCGESLLQGYFRSVPFGHLFLSILQQMHVVLELAMPYGGASVTTAGTRIRDVSGVAGLQTTRRAIVQVSGSVKSRHLFVTGHDSTHSVLDLAIADVLPCGCPARSGYSAKNVSDVSCMAGLLTTSRAIVQVFGCMRLPIASVHAAPPSAAFLLRLGLSLRCIYGKSSLQGYFCRVRSWHLFSSIHKRTHSMLDLAIADAVPFPFAAAGFFAAHAHNTSWMVGQLTTSRAIVHVSGWIRPPIASAHALPPSAASSHRQGVHRCASPCCIGTEHVFCKDTSEKCGRGSLLFVGREACLFS